MLILTRRVRQVVRIADNIRIVVLAVNGVRVRIGIEAPLDITVDREEIYLRKQAELNAARAQRQGEGDDE
jgi:carbon storage regulator